MPRRIVRTVIAAHVTASVHGCGCGRIPVDNALLCQRSEE